MAHVFTWKAIYRIIKNQRSPEIEEYGRKYSEEYAGLLGSCAYCLIYLVKTNIQATRAALGETTLKGLITKTISQVVNVIRAYGMLINPAILDALVMQSVQAKGVVASAAEQIGELLSQTGGQVGGQATGG